MVRRSRRRCELHRRCLLFLLHTEVRHEARDIPRARCGSALTIATVKRLHLGTTVPISAHGGTILANGGILSYLLVAALTGGVVAWLLRRASMRAIEHARSEWMKRLDENTRERLALEHDRDAARQQLDSTKADLLAANSARSMAENELALMQRRVTAAESSLADAIREGERLSLTIAGLKNGLSEKDQELALARKRVGELEPLSVQLAERDARMRESETAHAKALREKDAELVSARSRLRELEPLPSRMKEQKAALHDLEGRLAETLTEKTRLLSRCDELQRHNDELRARIDDLEKSRQSDHVAFEAHMADLETLGANLRLAQTKVQALENILHDTEERETLLKRVESRVRELEQLPAQLAERDNQLASLDALVKEREGGMERLRHRILYLEGEVSRISQERGLETTQLRERIEELEPLSGRLAELAAQHQELKDRHQWLVKEKDAEIYRLRTRVGELEPLGGVLADRDARLRDMEHALLRAAEDRDTELGQLRARVGELESHASVLEEREQYMQHLGEENRKLVVELEALRGRLQSPSVSPSRGGASVISNDVRDDLKLIHGVGPALERKLNTLGIFTFREVALWTDQEIDRIDAQLEHFQGRIRRESWVQSAKEQYFKKYGKQI
jgi:predicted flap endonuclease-1-like 5' DNA nuclease